jgi:hypothetical protein
MRIESCRIKASALVPVQQFGNVALEVEVIYVSDDEAPLQGAVVAHLAHDVRGMLVQEVQRLNQENAAVKAWLTANGT